MVEQSRELTRRLLDLMQKTGYTIVQNNGQRRYGPPPDWIGPPPARGSEVFVGKLPREIFEDELVPIFSMVGKIYEMRLMMDFSGSNRGYSFVTYSSPAEAFRAVKELNNYEIEPGRKIGVVKSVDNCRLFVGCIPKDKTRDEVHSELAKRVRGIVDVILYKNCYDRKLNRGFAFVEFETHRAAAMARRTLVPGCVKLWDQEVTVDWAEPEPSVDDEQMKKVKVLYVRNFLIRTSPDKIRSVFEDAIGAKLERVKKIYDYAFIHFHQREHAERAMRKLQNADIDGSNVEIRWAKPVDSELYRIQKMTRGNAKFNKNTYDHNQTLWLYKQHLAKKEYAKSPKEDEGFGSAYASSLCESPNSKTSCQPVAVPDPEYLKDYALPPAKLDSICNRYQWTQPVYEYQKFLDPQGMEMWVCKVELPEVGWPLATVPRRIGPLLSGSCYTMQQAQVEAASQVLIVLEMLRGGSFQVQSSPTPMQPMYPSIVPPVPSYMRVPYSYLGTSACSQQLSPLPFPAIWRSV